MNTTTHKQLTVSHGELVIKDEVAPSAFLREVNDRPGSRRCSHTLEELAEIVKENFHNQEPGVGSVDGDVLLISVPTDGFFTNIVPITEENARLIETTWNARVEGEAPVARQVIRSTERFPASVVKIVVYRADTLARDAGRSSEAEWEMVAILSNPAEEVPMHPSTMLRNYRHELGGTYREYTAEQWATAYEFWSRHVQLVDPEPESTEA